MRRMLELKDKPQVLEHKCLSLSLTPYDTKWIPSSARFVMLVSCFAALNRGFLMENPVFYLLFPSKRGFLWLCGRS